ncbi:MAG: PAS domain S-box protein [Pseudomonadales bacterium]|nr:PAS domain S-box protein [Pseudomonadales bacterium]
MKLATRVQLLVVAITLILTLSVSLLLREQSVTLHTHSQRVLAETLMSSLRNAIVQDAIDGNSLRVANVLRNIRGSTNAIEFLYVARGGKIFAHSFEAGFPLYLLGSYPGKYNENSIQLVRKFKTETGLVYEYSGALIPGLGEILYIGLNQSEMKSHLLESAEYTLLSGLIIGMLSLLLANFFVRRLTQPLSELSAEIQTYGGGKAPDLKRFENATIEIKSLAAAFDNASQERHKSYLELARKEQNLKVTLESIGDAVIVTDINGHVIRMNPVAEQLTAWSFEDAKGQNLKKVFPIIDATSRKVEENPAEKVFETGEIVYLSNHTTLVSKDGIERQIADSAAPICDEEGNVMGVILVFHDVTEDYQLRQSAAAANRRIQELVDDMQTMVGLVELDGTLTFINNTPLQLIGLKAEDVLGKKLWETPWLNYDPQIVKMIKQDCSEAAKGISTSHELEIAIPEGTTWVDFSIHPIFDENGIVKQIVPEARDISRRKLLDEELSSSLHRMKMYREQSPAATIDWDLDSNIVEWNQAAEKIFGFSAEEAIGQSYEIIIPDNVTSIAEKIWENLNAVSGGEISINENKTKDGNIIICEWHNCSIVNKAGELVGFSSFALDVTERYRSEQALQNKEKQQRQMLDSMVDGIITVAESGVVVNFNRAAEKMFVCSTKDIIGKNFSDLVAPSSMSIYNTFFSQCHIDKDDGYSSNIEVQAQKWDQSNFPLRIFVAKLPGLNGSDRHYIFSCHDLTDIKQQEEQLRRAQKMDALGKLTGGIAHDYNNMLGIVLGYSELLSAALIEQPKLAKYAQEIYRASERGGKLTKKLLAFSQEKKAEATEMDLNIALHNEQNMLEKILTARVELKLDLEENLWPVYLDSSDLEDAVINLSINALHSMDGQGTLTIKTHNIKEDEFLSNKIQLVPGDYIQIIFTDTGCGMDEETIARIFDPFYSTKGDLGTGLGLSQVYGFVERSNGAINVYSEIGKGSQFNLYFPRYLSDSIGKKLDKKEPHNLLKGSETILVVDDERALLEVTSEILSAKGYNVIQASRAKDALKILQEKTVDLLLSDVIMPEMDGYELANIVQKKYPAIKIQLASGFSDNRHVSLLDETLRKRMINKPYRGDVLLARVREILDA